VPTSEANVEFARLLLDAKLNQTQAAEVVGVSQSAVSQYLRGDSTPTEPVLRHLRLFRKIQQSLAPGQQTSDAVVRMFKLVASGEKPAPKLPSARAGERPFEVQPWEQEVLLYFRTLSDSEREGFLQHLRVVASLLTRKSPAQQTSYRKNQKTP
jgi:predicted transcriptional regulator